jgi:hypothetical protein
VQARLEGEAQCLLVIIGATAEGKKELVGLIDGVRESAQSWKELLLDRKRRGLSTGPELAVADGALGFWQAIEEVWPKTRGQRLGTQNRQRAQQAAEEPAIESQAGAPGDLVGRDQKRCARRVLRLSRRALEASAHHERHRQLIRHDPPPHGAFQRMSLEQDRARHNLQARRGRREKLASP